MEARDSKMGQVGPNLNLGSISKMRTSMMDVGVVATAYKRRQNITDH